MMWRTYRACLDNLRRSRVTRSLRRTASSAEQPRENPQVGPEEVPGLLERLAEVPDPRDPRGVRHRLAVVLALTACAVPAVTTSPLAIGSRLADRRSKATRPHFLRLPA